MQSKSILTGLSAAFLAAGISSQPLAAASLIKVAIGADIRSINPGVNRDGNTDGVVLNMVEGLVGYRANGTVGPLLAESVNLSDDKRTYTFKLRKDVKFHNGASLTSADVVWNWQRYMAPATDWRCRRDFDGSVGLKVEEVKAVDDYTVTMRLAEPSGLFLDGLARLDCGMTAIIHKDSIRADGSFDRPVGTGPFRFADRKIGQSVTLRKFDGYSSPPGDKSDGYLGKKQAEIDEVQFVVLPDASTTIAAMKTGDIDIAQVSVDSVKDFSGTKIKVLNTPTAAKYAYLFQTRDPLLSDAKMRQAIASALDLKEITAAVSNGLGTPNASAVYIGSLYHNDTQKKTYAYDEAKAKSLLKEAGYDGRAITMLANRNNEGHFQLAVVAQAMMQAAGINANIEVLDWATQLDRYQKGNYQMMSFSYSPRFDPALSYEQFSGPKATQSRKVWENPDALKIIDGASASSDEKERSRMFDDLHNRQLADTPLILVFNRVEVFAISPTVTGFEPWFASTPRLWNTRKQ